MNKICIAISTYGERINSIKIPDYIPRVSYLIVHQMGGEIHFSEALRSILKREDVRYFHLENSGLSKSRNCALQMSESDYVHIMDDDVTIDPISISRMADLALKNRVDIALGYFRYDRGSASKNRKTAGEVNLRFLFSVCSIEIGISKTTIESGIVFDENFGLGSDNPSGEELIFLTDVKRQGLNIYYYPMCVGVHPDGTSGEDFFTTEKKIYAKKNMFARAFPKNAFFLKVLFLMKKAPMLMKRKIFLRFFFKFLF